MSTADQTKFRWSIWILMDGQANQIYQSDSVTRLVGWSPSGNGLIIKSIDGNKEQISPEEVSIFQISLDSSAPYLISKLNVTYFYNIQLSPDRKTLAYVTRAGGTDAIQTVPANGGVKKTLISSSDARVYFSSLTFAPDGKALYYGKQAKWQIISMIDSFK
jgi:Tol biopolymer transport system component